jgi:hypothetical protein
MTQGCVLIEKNEHIQPKKSIMANILVFMCFFSFYYLFVFKTLPEVGISDILTMMQASFLFIVALTIVVSGHLTPNLGKKHITVSSLCMIATLPLLIVSRGYPCILFPIFLISVFFGISQLAYYKVFWTNTNSAKRSRIAGIIGFSAVILYFTTTIISSIGLNFIENIALCLLLITGSTLGSALIREGPEDSGNTRKMVYYPERRTIIFYAVPWVFFSFLNVTLTKNITIVTSALNSSSIYLFLYGSQVIGGVFGALIGGYFADKVGRRLTLVFSVALYGVSMAFRGFTDNGVTLLFSFIGEGLTWGIFLTLYCFVIWGDLSNTKNVEKTYAIGLATFYATAGLGVFNLFAGIPVIESTLSSCIMIFLAIIPIVLAPELLTSEAQEKNKLKKYMETVRKVADESE